MLPHSRFSFSLITTIVFFPPIRISLPHITGRIIINSLHVQSQHLHNTSIIPSLSCGHQTTLNYCSQSSIAYTKPMVSKSFRKSIVAKQSQKQDHTPEPMQWHCRRRPQPTLYRYKDYVVSVWEGRYINAPTTRIKEDQRPLLNPSSISFTHHPPTQGNETRAISNQQYQPQKHHSQATSIAFPIQRGLYYTERDGNQLDRHLDRQYEYRYQQPRASTPENQFNPLQSQYIGLSAYRPAPADAHFVHLAYPRTSNPKGVKHHSSTRFLFPTGAQDAYQDEWNAFLLDHNSFNVDPYGLVTEETRKEVENNEGMPIGMLLRWSPAAGLGRVKNQTMESWGQAVKDEGGKFIKDEYGDHDIDTQSLRNLLQQAPTWRQALANPRRNWERLYARISLILRMNRRNVEKQIKLLQEPQIQTMPNMLLELRELGCEWDVLRRQEIELQGLKDKASKIARSEKNKLEEEKRRSMENKKVKATAKVNGWIQNLQKEEEKDDDERKRLRRVGYLEQLEEYWDRA